MPDKLSQSLDQILSERRKTTGARGGRPRGRRSAAGTAVPTPPVGGVKKTTRAEKKPEKASIPTGPSRAGDGKIIVSNLPFDVTEAQIKEYFSQTIGAVKKIELSYGPNGKSRGIATLTFSKPALATQAAKELDGLKVDSRVMKIEVIVGAKDVPSPPAPKSLKDRVAHPKVADKDKPKPATADKAGNTVGAAARGRKRGGRGRGAAAAGGRAKPKTAEELDAEMADYWGGETATGTADAPMSNGGAVQPTATNGGEAIMEDDVIA